MSSCETEGAEISDEELSSSDFESSSNPRSGDEFSMNEEEQPLQADVHQQNLVAIHLTEQQKKGEGEVNGLRYIKVDDDEEDVEDLSEEEVEKWKLKKCRKQVMYREVPNHRMVLFPLPATYPVSDTLMLMCYLTSAFFICALIVLIPLTRRIISPYNALFAAMALLSLAMGVFMDGTFWLNFNVQKKEVYVLQKMCGGICVCGNRGVQGQFLGTFEALQGAGSMKVDDIIGESTMNRYSFMMMFNDHEKGDQHRVLFNSTNEDMVRALEYNVNEWWNAYNDQHDILNQHENAECLL